MDEFCGSAARGDHVEPTSAYRQFLWQPENAICNWIAMVVVIEHPSVKSTLGQDGLNFGKIQTDESRYWSRFVCVVRREVAVQRQLIARR